MANIVTYTLAFIAAISAAAVLFVKEVFHATLLLLICLICIAGIFVTFNAEFLAIVQILVYAGGVVLLVVFGIMLTVRSRPLEEPGSQNMVLPGIVGMLLFAVLVYALDRPAAPTLETHDLSPEVIGALLMTRYAIAFEIAGMLLLVSLIGAIVAATQGKRS
ncbi:MAG TPA: NADH-quinone oxidoreductase subunit J [Cyclobacteriaceae bacterium]|nr:NADH-quinone oxidoreductase subunit J [Cyclobacteriaceae bacterium]